MRVFFLLIPFFLFHAVNAFGHESTTTRADILLVERLGETISPDAVFMDDNDRSVSLKTLIDRPTIIAPVYLGCTHECPMLLTGLAQVLGKLDLVVGRDYKVIALSFDDQDTPDIARDKKKNYIKAVGKLFHDKDWPFLTGTDENIHKFTDSIGFKFQRDGDHSFSHPITLVVVAPGGKIVRYLDGLNFLPFDVTMAVNEAAEGRVGSTGRRVLMYCFSYDPLKKSYVFNILKVVGTMIVLFVGFFFSYLMITTKTNKKGSV